jgi:hypothetical protein
MRARLHIRLIGAFLLPALIASGAAQGMLLMRCGPAVRMSCCCPKEQAPAPVSTIKGEKLQCCDTVAIPAGPAQAAHEQAVSAVQPPTLVAVAGVATRFELLVDRVGRVPQLDPPPGPPLVLANCSLLI